MNAVHCSCPVHVNIPLLPVSWSAILSFSKHDRNGSTGADTGVGVKLALALIRRQMHLIGESFQSVLWQLKEVQHLQSLGEVDLPITAPELIRKLELLAMETIGISEAMETVEVHLSFILPNDKKIN